MSSYTAGLSHDPLYSTKVKTNESNHRKRVRQFGRNFQEISVTRTLDEGNAQLQKINTDTILMTVAEVLIRLAYLALAALIIWGIYSGACFLNNTSPDISNVGVVFALMGTVFGIVFSPLAIGNLIMRAGQPREELRKYLKSVGLGPYEAKEYLQMNDQLKTLTKEEFLRSFTQQQVEGLVKYGFIKYELGKTLFTILSLKEVREEVGSGYGKAQINTLWATFEEQRRQAEMFSRNAHYHLPKVT